MARFTVIDDAKPAELTALSPGPEPAPRGKYTVVDENAPSAIEALLRGALQGATFEWADEIAGVTGLADKDAMRARTKAIADAHPRMFTAGKVAGSFAVPMGGAVRAAKSGMSLGGVAKSGAMIGGVSGGLEAAGELENADLGKAAGRVALGTAVGAGAGAVISPLVYSLLGGGRAAVRAAYDHATEGADAGMNSALRKTEQALRRQDADPDALMRRLTADASPTVQNAPSDILSDVLRLNASGKSASEIAQEVNKARGTYLSPQQVGGLVKGFDRANPTPRDLLKLSEEVGGVAGRSGLTSLMQGVTSIPGRGREIALRNMGATMEDAPQRMAQRLSGQMGDLKFRQNLRMREQQRKATANKAYGDAYNSDPNVVDLQHILDSYAVYGSSIGGDSAAKLLQAIQVMTGTRPGSTPLKVDNLQRYHQARVSLDRMMSDLRGGANPDKNALRMIGNMRRDLNAAVHKNNPKFKAADEGFASDSVREEAMKLGREMDLRSGAKHDEIVTALEDLQARFPRNAIEIRDMFSEGVLRGMADRIETAGGIPGQWVQPLTGGVRPAPRQALQDALALPLPGAKIAKRSNASQGVVGGQPVPFKEGRDTARNAAGVLDEEARLKKIFVDVFGNSNTAGKLQAIEDLRELPRLASELATGGFGALRNAIANRLMQAMTEKNAEQVARIVTETDPRLLYVALSDIRRMAPAIKRGERVMATPAIGVGAASGQAMTGN